MFKFHKRRIGENISTTISTIYQATEEEDSGSESSLEIRVVTDAAETIEQGKLVYLLYKKKYYICTL